MKTIELRDKANTKITVYEFKSKSSPKAIIQLFHGAGEHALRYQETAEALTQKGYHVLIHDQIGHGATAVHNDFVFFAKHNGAQKLIDASYEVYQYSHQLEPDLPIFAIAHSMGSLVLRAMNNQYPELYHGVVYIGSPYMSTFKVKMIQRLAKLIKTFKGDLHISKLITNMTQDRAYQSMKKRGLIEYRHEWVTSNVEIQRKARKDPKIGQPFTISAQLDLFQLIILAHQKSPFPGSNQLIYVLCGDQDALCEYGQKVSLLGEFFDKQGNTNVKHKVYVNSRHEILNEPVRHTVLNDIDFQFEDCIKNC